MEIFLIAALTTLIAIFIVDTSRKRRAYLCQRVESATHPPTIRK